MSAPVHPSDPPSVTVAGRNGRRRPWWATTLLAALSCVVALLGAPTPAGAVPVEGHARLTVLLCQFADDTSHTENPSLNSAAAVRAYLLTRGTGGLADYYAATSRGRIDLAGSTVSGWYTMTQRFADEASRTREQRTQGCRDAAVAAGASIPAGNRVVVFRNRCYDGGFAGNGMVLLDPCAGDLSFAAHEIGHALGLGHSFSDDTGYRNAPWSAPGEYDDEWDLMSALHVITRPNSRYGSTPVGLNAYFSDKLGWLPENRIRTWGADGVASGSATISPLYGTTGTALLRIPLDPGDLYHYLTVEYRTPTGADAPLTAPIVLLHEVKGGTPYLLRVANGRNPDQSYTVGGTTVQVTSTGGATATVAVRTDMVQRCVVGYVWRGARSGDVVCVTGATRSQTWADNAAAPSRWVNGAYGPHTCVNGYVWREAFAGDDVCVTGATRSQAAADNAAAASRANPARLVFGPNTCAAGYVWRAADAADHVCVTGATRSQTWADNAAAASRWVNGAYGPHTCVSGYVWREAFPADDVCVTGAVRSGTAADTISAGARVANPTG